MQLWMGNTIIVACCTPFIYDTLFAYLAIYNIINGPQRVFFIKVNKRPRSKQKVAHITSQLMSCTVWLRYNTDQNNTGSDITRGVGIFLYFGELSCKICDHSSKNRRKKNNFVLTLCELINCT